MAAPWDLSRCYIVMTSNIGSSEVMGLHHSAYATMERHVLTRAQQSLRPELYARLTEKLVFNRLTYDVQVEVARLRLDEEIAFYAGRVATGSPPTRKCSTSSCASGIIPASVRGRYATR